MRRFRLGDRRCPRWLSKTLSADVEVMITETRLNDVLDYGAWVARKAPGATAAKHVVVELRRPS